MITKSKGFAHIVLLFAIVIVAVAGAGYFAYKNGKLKIPKQNVPLTDLSISTTPAINITSWKTYTDQKIGFEFKYPNSYQQISDDPNHVVFGVNVPPSSSTTLPILQIFTEPQVDISSLVPCPQNGGVSPCISVGGKIEKIQIDGKETIKADIDDGDYAHYRIIQIPDISVEMKMDIGDGRDRIFNQILSTFKLLNGDITPTSTQLSPEKDICVISGCSSEICAEEEMFSTCILKPENACYKTATCQKQENGKCGWTQTDELRSCLNKY